MFRIAPLALLLVGVFSFTACAPATPSATGGGRTTTVTSEAAPTGSSQPNRALRIVMRAEPGSLGSTILIPTGITSSTERRMFNASLAYRDAQSAFQPYLAEAIPTLSSGAWQLFPDGRMETTWRLRPNLTWHDGKPLTADDFVFAWSIYTSSEFGTSGALPHRAMEEIVAPDARTVVIRWKYAYPDATDLHELDFAPLPRHLLEPIYQRERANLPNSTFWTTDYVGAGPYKLERWQNGAFMEATAFAGHVLGKPRIERVNIIWNGDFNATLATLLAGEADMPANDSIRVEQGLILEREWGARSAGTVTYRPNLPRLIQVQHRAEYADPPAVRDVRVRKALAHAIEKKSINDALFEGKGITTSSLIYPTIDYYPLVDQAVVKYPFDLTRTERLMSEAGYYRSGGLWTSPDGSRVNLEVRNIQSPQNDSERSIIAAGWRTAGFSVEEDNYTASQTRDGQLLGTFRSLSITSTAAVKEGLNMTDYTTASVSRPETRWFGLNRGGWSSNEYDRVIGLWLTTMDPKERQFHLAQAMKVFTDDVGAIPLHFNPGVVAHAAGLQGVSVKSPDADIVWNMHEWSWR